MHDARPQPESWSDWQIAAGITISLRIFYSAVAALLSFVLHPAPALIHGNALTENLPVPGTWHYALLGIWERFDTLWYLRIAERGYDLAASVVFYPLYPAMIRLLTPLAGCVAGALIISTCAAFFFYWGMLSMIRAELPDTPPFRILVLTAVWPASFFLFAGYSEALAMALVVWCIVLGRGQRWTASAACACATGLTRSMGTLLIVPLFIMAWRSRRISAWPVLLSPLGTVTYWIWLHATGRLSIVTAYERFWSTQVAVPWTTVWRAATSLAHHPDSLLAISLAALGLFAGTGVIARRRLEDRAFSAAVILHILLRACTPPLLGTPRYLLPIYPAFLTMGSWLQRMKPRRFLFLCSVLFLFNLVWMASFLKWSLVL
jgi:hypothetical protein